MKENAHNANMKLYVQDLTSFFFFFYLTRKIIPYRTVLNDQGIIIDKKKQNHTAEYISIDQKNINTSSSVKLLGVHIDDKLNFNLHITKTCRYAAN